MFKVFVYGTLKRKGAFHHLLSTAEFLGTATTREKLPMMVLGIPYVFDMPGQGHHIKGEVFDVDAPTLERLDRLEHHPTWYCRKLTDVILGKAETDAVQAWLYYCQDPRQQASVVQALQRETSLIVPEFKARSSYY